MASYPADLRLRTLSVGLLPRILYREPETLNFDPRLEPQHSSQPETRSRVEIQLLMMQRIGSQKIM